MKCAVTTVSLCLSHGCNYWVLTQLKVLVKLMFAWILLTEVFSCFSDLTACTILIHKNVNHECMNCVGKIINDKLTSLCYLALKCQCKKMFCGPEVLEISHLTKTFFFFFFLRMSCILCATLLEKFSALLYSREMEYKLWLNILFACDFFFFFLL